MNNRTFATVTKVINEDTRLIAQGLAKELTVLSGSSILVTGGSGLVCSYLLDTLAYLNDAILPQACRVISIDNLRSGVSERVAHLASRPDFRFISHDVSRPLVLGETVEWIVHGASIASPTFYRKYPLETVDVNVTGTRLMLDRALSDNVKGVLYLSTSEVYGDPDKHRIPTPEAYRGNVSCTGPRACYDESKRLAETLCAIYHRLYGVPIKVLRPFNIYGPGQRLDDGRIVPDLMRAALNRAPLVLLSDGRATRSFCYVSDAVRAMLLVLVSHAHGEVFNVGNDEKEISVADLAHELAEIAGPPPLQVIFGTSADPQYLTDNPQRRWPDLTKLRRHFGWKPEVSISKGLRRTLQSYQESACLQSTGVAQTHSA